MQKSNFRDISQRHRTRETPRSPTAQPHLNMSNETNIQVVVRIRPRNEKEKRENSPVWISTPTGTKGKELSVKMGSNEKTYTFDKVFGPDVDQETIFSDVVTNMLEEVLAIIQLRF